MCGVQKAAEAILNSENLTKFKYIKIFTDSQATLLALNTTDVTSKLVLQTKVALNELAKKTRRVTIVWIKVHVGHEGNELADELAKEGTKKKLLASNIGIPHNNIKTLIKSAHCSIWDNEWAEYKEAKHTKHFNPESNETRAKEAIKLSRLELARLVKLITDHGDLVYFNSKLEPVSYTHLTLPTIYAV